MPGRAESPSPRPLSGSAEPAAVAPGDSLLFRRFLPDKGPNRFRSATAGGRSAGQPRASLSSWGGTAAPRLRPQGAMRYELHPWAEVALCVSHGASSGSPSKGVPTACRVRECGGSRTMLCTATCPSTCQAAGAHRIAALAPRPGQQAQGHQAPCCRLESD